MNNWKLSKLASKDLEKIIRYTIETWGLEQGKKYDSLLIDAMNKACNEPKRGRSTEKITPNTKKWPVGRHFVIYRPTTYGILVLRILHEKMDISRHF